jgi:G3E family GTPase
MPPTRIPANVIFGATGAGKTHALTELLGQRPAHERWSILVNDFGRATYAGACGADERAVIVREVSGCFCCTGQVALRTAVVSLLRESTPDRLLIEASAAAHPAAILRVLHEPGIAAALEVRASVALARTSQLEDVRYAGSDVYREQLAQANVVVLTGAAGQHELRRARSALTALLGTTSTFADKLVLEMLDRPARA